ncbi:MAG: cation-translocating P-type ATPase [Actinomycetota bacterium]
MAETLALAKDDVAERPWWAVSPHEAEAALGADRERGLDEAEVERRREVFGENRLPERKGESLFGTLVRQFKDPLIYVLLIAGSVSLAIGNIEDAAFIFAVLAFNAGLGTYQERKAESAAAALQQVMRVTARVLRSGRRVGVDSSELVPGDLAIVHSGASVPADIRLLVSHDLRADESLLTGESVPVDKRAADEVDEDAGIGDRSTMLHAGTAIMSGRGVGVVARTSELTEVGRIAEALTEEEQVPPLVVRMRRFTRVIAVAVLAAVVVLGLIELIRGEDLVNIFFLAVALAVSAIPAGLPVAITVALAIGSSRMADRNVIVRRLPAVEGLGACTLIASDKTGTLTQNELTVHRIRPLDGEDVEITGGGRDLDAEPRRGGTTVDPGQEEWLGRLVTAGALCNEADVHATDEGVHTSGDTVDIAFLVLAHKLGTSREELLERYPAVGHIPFESERRFAASFHHDGDRVVAHVKGAAQTVVAMCDVDAEIVHEREKELAAEGYRVIAVASGEVDERTARKGDPEALTGLRFLGLAGLIDPVREEVPEAVRACHRAGVDVRMVTGDHPATALAISRELGIADDDDDVVTGREIERLERGESADAAASIRQGHVYARVEPRQKTTIVDTLQDAGHFVAVTGDGVNDAPALRTAHIGVSMGASGTQVARNASDLILTDDNFASIEKGIEEGRVAYDNVRKVIWLLISTGVAEILLFTLAVAFNTALPLTPVQLLWLNLVTNGIQDVALAFERGEPGVLDRRPRAPNERVFNRLMIEEVVISGLYMGLVAFGLFYVLTDVMGLGTFEARNLLLLLMVLFENVHAFNVRSETRSAFRIPLRANWLLVGAVVVAQSVHIGSMFVPGWQDVLEIEPVAVTTWAVLLAITLSLLAVVEAYKRLRGRGLAARINQAPAASPG